MSQKIRKFTIQQNVHRAKRPNPISRLFKLIFGLLGRLFGSGRGGHKRNRGKSKLKKFLSYLPTILIALVLAGTIGLLVVYAWVRQDLPDPNKIGDRAVAQTTKIYDRTGEVVLYEVHGDQKRTLVELDEISPFIMHATIVAEDRDFYTHRGFKLTGYVRAFIENLKSGHRGQGGSTITQQLVKNALLNPEKTYTRKLKELLLSIEIERSFEKDEILKMYLNEIPYGSVIYGIESAAESFFGKTASELTLSESALLASLPQSTTYLSPYGSHIDELIDRQQWILDSMAELGYITQEEADEAKKDDVLERIKPRTGNIMAPHFVFYVRELLADELGEQLVERGGLKITTTLDVDQQRAAEETIEERYDKLAEFEATNAALLSLDPKTGDILAMVGSADYFNDDISGQFNSLLGLRQPGSSIKPLVYSTSFEQGYTPNTVLFDVVTQFGAGAKPYIPQNYDLSEHGPMTVRESLAGSLNIPAVKMLYLAGLKNVIAKAGELGYTTLDDPDRFGLSLALGGGEVRPLEHIASFAAYANDGILLSPRSVLKVEDHDGNVLIDNTEKEPEGRRVLNEQTARQLNSILSDNPARAYAFGANSYLQLDDRPVAAKTGTTNSYKDAWTIGYTPSLVAGVWVGNSDGSEMSRGASGSAVAAPIWNSFMRKALTNMSWDTFPAPEPVETGKPVLDGNKESQVILKVDKISGLLATPYTPEELVEERGFGQPHSILFFVDKNDPRGPVPENPDQDPMYDFWEEGIAKWISKGDIGTIAINDNPPPIEEDNVHTPENKPRISILRPQNGDTIDTRDIFVDLRVSAQRGVAKVEFAINGDIFATLDRAPFSGSIPIPNRFPKGYHTVTMTAYDDVLNRASAEVTINLTADAGPIDVQWHAPYNRQVISSYTFPYTVRFSIEDNQALQSLELSASSLTNGTEEIIGSIENPPLPNMSMQWSEAPPSGRYKLRLTATLKGGERKTEEILVTVQ